MLKDVCLDRVQQRTDHPTIRFGGGERAVKGMAKTFEPPTAREGFVEVITILNDDEAATVLQRWGAQPPAVPPAGFFKFPRTAHVLDAGGTAVSRDDLLLPDSEAAQFFDGVTVVVAEEKVDGANLGISLTKDYEIRIQNRAHYVNTETHTQFRSLDAWVSDNAWAICQLLKPEDEILFGEWLYARHTVPYDRLPSYFLSLV